MLSAEIRKQLAESLRAIADGVEGPHGDVYLDEHEVINITVYNSAGECQACARVTFLPTEADAAALRAAWAEVIERGKNLL